MRTLAEVLEERKRRWDRLEQLLQESRRLRRIRRGAWVMELSDLYRSVCADLALADQYRLSPETVAYLHDLVGRSHNAIYRSRRFQVHEWWRIAFHDAPQQIFRDRCVQVCAFLFFGLFTLATYVAYDATRFPEAAEWILGSEHIDQLESNFENLEFGRDNEVNLWMVAFYIQHNTGIGLQCFALGPLIIPGLYATAYNATVLGASFGYMARDESPGGDQFLEFVTAHGTFELTAIALAAAAGLRIGTGWLFTRGMTRLASMQLRAREAVPVMAVSGVLFVLAALTEGLLSPSDLPYFFKALWAVFSSSLLMFYFVVLGYPAEDGSAT
ncbi:MAG: stage II sporulation protein M [Planctomycetota bacterium]|nr:MAG: stage II sporulation protein M [Planctomycetota bacterium]